MAVPKQKTTRSKRNQRRNHIRIDMPAIAECKNCGAMHRSHHICEKCGFYNGKQLIKIKS